MASRVSPCLTTVAPTEMVTGTRSPHHATFEALTMRRRRSDARCDFVAAALGEDGEELVALPTTEKVSWTHSAFERLVRRHGG